MGEKKRGVNTFDIVFILIILAAAVFLFFYLRDSAGEGELEIGDKVTYVLEIGSIETDTADKISAGDNLIDATTKISLGRITDVDIRKVENLTLDYEVGKYILTELPDKVAVRMTMEADIEETAMEILVEGQTDIRVSYTYNILGPGYVTTASVVSIERGTVSR